MRNETFCRPAPVFGRHAFRSFCLVLALDFNSSLANSDNLGAKLATAAIERTHKNIRYSGCYLKNEYQGDDVSDYIGVCTDLIVRAYGSMGINLQQLVPLTNLVSANVSLARPGFKWGGYPIPHVKAIP